MQKAIDSILTYIKPDTNQSKVRVVIYTDPHSTLVVLMAEKKEPAEIATEIRDNLEYIIPLVTSAYPQFFPPLGKTRWMRHNERTDEFSTLDWSPQYGGTCIPVAKSYVDKLIGKIDASTCNHPSFDTDCRVMRHTPDGTDPADPTIRADGFSLAMSVYCAMCGTPFSFKGLQPDQTSPNGTALILDILPGKMTPVAVKGAPVMDMSEALAANSRLN